MRRQKPPLRDRGRVRPAALPGVMVAHHPCRHPPTASASDMRQTAVQPQTGRKRQDRFVQSAENPYFRASTAPVRSMRHPPPGASATFDTELLGDCTDRSDTYLKPMAQRASGCGIFIRVGISDDFPHYCQQRPRKSPATTSLLFRSAKVLHSPSWRGQWCRSL